MATAQAVQQVVQPKVGPKGPTWTVLYLFAGKDREADLGASLTSALQELNSKTKSAMTITTENVDILRGGASHDLLDSRTRERLLIDISGGMYDLVLAAPPCRTFSRALFSDHSWPQPLRDFVHPRGYEGLCPADQKKIEGDNCLVDFALQALRTAGENSIMGWLEFPEDLGECKIGVPASIWQLPAARSLAKLGFRRCAIHQCHFAEVDYAKPTGFLTNVEALLKDPDVHVGWPTFKRHDSNGKGRTYTGPLPPKCKHGNVHAPLIGKDASGSWRTSDTAAYPAQMCQRLARHFIAQLGQRPPGQITYASPSGGASHAGIDGASLCVPFDLLPSESSKLVEYITAALDGKTTGSVALGLHGRFGEVKIGEGQTRGPPRRSTATAKAGTRMSPVGCLARCLGRSVASAPTLAGRRLQ